MKESRKQFILEAHKAACSEWKERIEKEFPKLFETKVFVRKLEVGVWYKSRGHLFNYQNGFNVYGFDSEGKWLGKNWSWETIFDDLKPATNEEVEAALIKEAKRRGFKEGVWHNTNNNEEKIKFDCQGELVMGYESESYALHFTHGQGLIYNEGQWAEIIPTITKAEAEKELGKTIID